MRSTNRDVAALLVACTREHDWSAPVPEAVTIARRVPADRVAAAAVFHRVIGCVVMSLHGAGVPDELSAALAPEARRSSGRAVLSAASLRTVRDAFGDDLPWLAMKGPVLDGVLYPRPRLRTYRDLDVLVDPHLLADAVARLEGVGFRVVDRNWRQIHDRMVSQLHLEREASAPIDLHWTLIFDSELRRTFRYDIDRMIARARSVEVAGGPVHTFDAADTLIHLAVHAAIEGADRLVWLKDVDVASRAPLDWDEVVGRSRAFGMQLPVATVLARSSRVLGTPVPVDVVGRLAPRTWRVLTATSDVVFPAAASHGLGSPATLLARSARGDLPTSLRRAARGLTRRARSAVTEGRIARVDRRSDPEHEGSLLYPAGGSRERDAYFARLASM